MTTGYDRSDFAASFCGAVVGALSKRLETAARQTDAKQIVIAGGVAANSYLRAAAGSVAQSVGAKLVLPPVALCGDNAAMIGAQGIYELAAGHTAGYDLNAMATRTIE
jgi:N6-L-threonylcarbamoyladenine synthase